MKTRISIVILHYNLIKDTIRCIDSIKKISTEDIAVNIIIVDNSSPNGTGKVLFDKYSKDEYIKVILAYENLGFARGNNLGFVYALENLNPNFIILSNNDVLIEQQNFFNELVIKYNEKKFAVGGPDILVPYSGVHQNPPSSDLPYTLSNITKQIKKANRQKDIYQEMKNNKVKSYFYNIYKSVRVFLKKYRGKANLQNTEYQFPTEQTKIHGSFMIFSQEYFNVFPNGLYDGTFMYAEEPLLHYLCLINNLKICYMPSLKILHLEGKSTRNNFSENSYLSKNIFYLTNLVDSLVKFRELIMIHGELK